MDDYKNVKEVTILVDGKKVHTRLFYCSKSNGLHTMPVLASRGKTITMNDILDVLHKAK